MTSQAQPEPSDRYPLTTPEAEAAYEAEYGPRAPGGPDPYVRHEPTPYDLWLTDDPQATWDDPSLAGPADRPVKDRAAEPEPELEIGGPNDDWDAYVNAAAARELDSDIEMSPDDSIVLRPEAEAEAWQTDAYTSGPEAEL